MYLLLFLVKIYEKGEKLNVLQVPCELSHVYHSHFCLMQCFPILFSYIFHRTSRVRAHSSWNQTDLCDADVKPNSDILFSTAALGHRGASTLVTSILVRPCGPLFGVLSSICLLCSFQWQLPRDVPLRGSVPVSGQSFDIKNTGMMPTEKQTYLRIYTVTS